MFLLPPLNPMKAMKKDTVKLSQNPNLLQWAEKTFSDFFERGIDHIYYNE
jgi:hypothetical protein